MTTFTGYDVHSQRMLVNLAQQFVQRCADITYWYLYSIRIRKNMRISENI